MPTLSSLRQVNEIETRYVVTGEDQARRAMEGVAAAQDKMARGAEAVAVVTEQSARRQLNASALLDRERKRVDAEYRQSQMLEKASGTFDRALSQGLIDQHERDRLGGLAQTRYGGTNDNDPTRRGLSSYDKSFIKYQGFDVASSLGSGAGLTTVAFQQGPQVLQQLADREGGLKAGLKQLGESAMGLVTPFTAAGAAVVAAAGVFALASSQYAKDQEALSRSLQTTGRSTDLSVSQLDALASRAAKAGKVSTSTAREIAAGYASTGEIAAPVFDTLISRTSEYARITGQEVPAATAELARMFADPAKGADDLGNKLGGLDDRTRQYVATLADQGDKTGAQIALAEALKVQIDANAKSTTAWGNAWNFVSSTADKAWESMKRAAGASVTTPQSVLADLNLRVSAAEKNGASSAFLDPLRAQRDAARAEVDRAEAAERARAATEQAVKASNEAGRVSRDYDPILRQRAQNMENLNKLNASLDDPQSRAMLADVDATTRARDAYKRAVDSALDANGKLITSEELLRRQDQLSLDATKAKTKEDQAAIAVRRAELDLIGKPVTPADAEARKLRAGILARAQEDAKGGSKSDAETRDDYDRATHSLEDRIRRQGEEATTYGMGAEAVARYRTEQELLTAAKRADRDITPELTAQIQGYVDRSGEAAKRLEEIRDSSRRVDEYRTLGSDGVRTFVRGLSDGVTQGKLLENVLSSLKNRAADLAANSISDMLFGKRNGSDYGLLGSLFGDGTFANAPLAGAQGPTAQAGGLSGLFASAKSFFGFSEGGYTGGGGRLQPAGIVHRGEYVFDQDSVRRMGVSNLDAMRRGLRGYDTGGYVGPSVGQMVEGQKAAASSNGGPPSITFITPPGTNLEPEGPPQRRADGGYEQVLRHVEGGLGKRARNGQGPFGQATGGAGFRIG